MAVLKAAYIGDQRPRRFNLSYIDPVTGNIVAVIATGLKVEVLMLKVGNEELSENPWDDAASVNSVDSPGNVSLETASRALWTPSAAWFNDAGDFEICLKVHTSPAAIFPSPPDVHTIKVYNRP